MGLRYPMGQMSSLDNQVIVIADTDGIIQVWSAGGELLMGYSAADAVGQSLNLIVPEKYQPAHWAAFHKAIKEGTSRIDGLGASDVSVRCKDGEIRPFTSRFHLLKNGLGQTIGAMTIFVKSG